MWFYVGEMKGDKGDRDSRYPLLVCCMVDWGKGRCLPFFKFFPVLGENKLFLEKRNRIGLNRKFSVSLQDNDMHKP
jgi:hypothetical protein